MWGTNYYPAKPPSTTYELQRSISLGFRIMLGPMAETLHHNLGTISISFLSGPWTCSTTKFERWFAIYLKKKADYPEYTRGRKLPHPVIEHLGKSSPTVNQNLHVSKPALPCLMHTAWPHTFPHRSICDHATALSNYRTCATCVTSWIFGPSGLLLSAHVLHKTPR